MNSSTIIIFGMIFSVLLIFSCISLNAGKYYSELGLENEDTFYAKPTIVLKDRNPQKIFDHSDFVKKEMK